jgi:flagellar assembly protein FliH
MDSLIRAPRLASERTRLSGIRVPTSGSAETSAPAQSDREILRQHIEKEVRAELSAQLHALRESEREKAHADGYADGLAEARESASIELTRIREQLGEQLGHTLSALEQAHRCALSKLEASVAEVAFAAVCRLLHREATSREFVLSTVERACARLRTETVATARLHPRDIEALGELLQGETEIRLRSLCLRVVADESLQLGGCVIEAASGQYDGGLENQLRRLHAALTAPRFAHSDSHADGSDVR